MKRTFFPFRERMRENLFVYENQKKREREREREKVNKGDKDVE